MTMTDTTPHELDVDTARIVSHLVDLQAKIAELTAQAEAAKAELRATVATGDHTINGQPVLRIQPTRRFDAAKALTYVPEELRSLCLSEVVDAKKVRGYLAPAVADTCMVDAGKPKVVVL